MAAHDVPQLKTCTKCNASRPLGDFPRDRSRPDGRFPWCKLCKRVAGREAYLARPEPAKERAARARAERPHVMREWREKNRDRIRDYNVSYYAENRDRERERWQRYTAENPQYYRAPRLRNRERYLAIARRRRSTPKGKLDAAMSRGINRSLAAGAKGGRRWECLVGYTVADLMLHLEKQFEDGMTWENHGPLGWHIDHIVPLSAFNFESPDHIDFKRAWALSNLRPLWWRDNLKKHAKIAAGFQPSLAI